jgi:hypothetical protein
MLQTENLYDVVERAAVRRQIPRLELWKLVASAITKTDLPVSYPSERFRLEGPAWPEWMMQFQNAVDRDNDPNRFGAPTILRLIKINIKQFDRWLTRTTNPVRGPAGSKSGWASADRKMFPEIKKLMSLGKASSAYNAALKLAYEDKLAGGGSEQSKAKRVAGRYLRSK